MVLLSEQQSGIVEYISAKNLKPKQFSIDLYGDDNYLDLVESIKNLGIIQAIYINQNNEIVSGHRRWQAANSISFDFPCPCIRKQYPDELDERQAIIEFNRYRIKTGQQLYNEGKGLEGIYSERAKVAQIEAGKQYHVGSTKVPQNFGEPLESKSTKHDNESAAQIAKTIGLGSGEQWRKLDYVAQRNPELLNKINSSNNGGMSIHRAYIKAKGEEEKETTANNKIDLENIEIPENKYRAIVIDPPWPTQKIIRDVRPNQVEFDYPTMAIDEIAKFPLKDYAASTGCHVYLWTTHKYLPDALEIFKTWGVEYQCVLTWIKNVGISPFSWMYSTELCLFGHIGSLPLLKMGKRIDFEAKVREHSRKPEEFYNLVREVSPEPRLDIFSREKHEGFEQFGNETSKFETDSV